MIPNWFDAFRKLINLNQFEPIILRFLESYWPENSRNFVDYLTKKQLDKLPGHTESKQKYKYFYTLVFLQSKNDSFPEVQFFS